MMIANITACHTLQDAVRFLGTELPEELQRPLEAYALVQKRRGSRTKTPPLQDLIASDKPITEAAIDELIDGVALGYARGQVSREVSEDAERVTLSTFRTSLMGVGGDALTESLQPAFRQACEDLEAVMRLITPT